jgi:hypothetical protein
MTKSRRLLPLMLSFIVVVGCTTAESSLTSVINGTKAVAQQKASVYFAIQMHIEPHLYSCFRNSAVVADQDRPPGLSAEQLADVAPMLSTGSLEECRKQAEADAHDMDQVLNIFETAGLPLSLDIGLTYAQSNFLAQLDASTKGSVKDMLQRFSGKHEGAIHCHWPSPFGHRGVFNPVYRQWYREQVDPQASFAEDFLEEQDLTPALLSSGIAKRIELVRQVVGEDHPVTTAASCIGLTSDMGIRARGGGINGPVKHSRMHAENLREMVYRLPREADANMTSRYDTGGLDYDYDGWLVNVPSGVLTSNFNPTFFSQTKLIELLDVAIAHADPNRINANVLSSHPHEFTRGDFCTAPQWETFLAALKPYVESGAIIPMTRAQIYQKYLAWEASGNVPYPNNGNFEVDRRVHDVLCGSDGVMKQCEQLQFLTDWMLYREEESVAQDTGPAIVADDDGNHAFHFGGGLATLTPGNSASPGHVDLIKEEDGDYLSAGLGIEQDSPIMARLQSGTRYTFSFWYRSEAKADTLTVEVGFYQDRAAAVARESTMTCTGVTAPQGASRGWQQYSLACQVPTDAEYTRLFFSATAGYLDNIAIRAGD